MNDVVEINYDYLEEKDIDRVVAIEEESNSLWSKEQDLILLL